MNREDNGKLWVRLSWTMLAFVACSMQVRPFLQSFRPRDGMIPDFYEDWASARNSVEGQPIYTHHSVSINRYQKALHFSWENPSQVDIEFNGHPPTSVLLALPLARLDFADAFLAWNVVSFGALCATVVIIMRQWPGVLTPWSILPVAALLLWSSPLRQQFLQGQLNLVLLLLFTAAWSADRTAHPWLAGGCIGIATAIKLFPGYLLLYFAARKQWRPLVAAAGSFLAVTLLTLLLLGPECYRDYLATLAPSQEEWRVYWLNISLAGFWHKLFNSQGSKVIPLWQNPALAWAATLGSDAILTALTAWCSWNSRSGRQRDLAFSLTLVAMLLVSPITWDHYLTLTLLPLFLLWFCSPSHWRARLPFWIILIGICVAPLVYWRLAFSGATFQNWQQLTATPRQVITALSIHTYVLVGLFVFNIFVFRGGEGTGPPASPPETSTDELRTSHLSN